MRGRVLCCLVLVAACNFDPRGATATDPDSDSGVAAADGATADTDAAPAELNAFDTPTIVPSLSDPNAEDDDPTVTSDLLELYFNSTRLGTADIFRSMRTSVNDPWGAPELVMELSGGSTSEQDPEVSGDGLTIWFASDRDSGNLDIFFSTRVSRNSAWSAPQIVAELNSSSPDFSPAPVTPTKQLITSARDGSRNIYMSERATTSEMWGTPQRMDDINSSQNDQSGFLAPDQRHMFLASERNGDRDVFVAERTGTTGPFSSPVPIAEINSGVSDSDPWVSADLRYIIFASDRTGITDIYEAHAAE